MNNNIIFKKKSKNNLVFSFLRCRFAPSKSINANKFPNTELIQQPHAIGSQPNYKCFFAWIWTRGVFAFQQKLNFQ